ncbi:MAG TPA: hypothetical protein VD999_00830 [Vitreimonas sp.]|nr:hypothetical protein [Vitreimonas sp.]
MLTPGPRARQKTGGAIPVIVTVVKIKGFLTIMIGESGIDEFHILELVFPNVFFQQLEVLRQRFDGSDFGLRIEFFEVQRA